VGFAQVVLAQPLHGRAFVREQPGQRVPFLGRGTGEDRAVLEEDGLQGFQEDEAQAAHGLGLARRGQLLHELAQRVADGPQECLVVLKRGQHRHGMLGQGLGDHVEQAVVQLFDQVGDGAGQGLDVGAGGLLALQDQAHRPVEGDDEPGKAKQKQDQDVDVDDGHEHQAGNAGIGPDEHG